MCWSFGSSVSFSSLNVDGPNEMHWTTVDLQGGHQDLGSDPNLDFYFGLNVTSFFSVFWWIYFFLPVPNKCICNFDGYLISCVSSSLSNKHLLVYSCVWGGRAHACKVRCCVAKSTAAAAVIHKCLVWKFYRSFISMSAVLFTFSESGPHFSWKHIVFRENVAPI